MHSLEQSKRQKMELGKYDVIAHLATGGMSAVYQAFDREKNRPVALKVLKQDLAENPSTLKRFIREARAIRRLRHKNIVRVYELGKKSGAFYIAMEYVEGID